MDITQKWLDLLFPPLDPPGRFWGDNRGVCAPRIRHDTIATGRGYENAMRNPLSHAGRSAELSLNGASKTYE